MTKAPGSIDWKRGYAAGKSRARIEILALTVVAYFSIVLIGRFFG